MVIGGFRVAPGAVGLHIVSAIAAANLLKPFAGEGQGAGRLGAGPEIAVQILGLTSSLRLGVVFHGCSPMLQDNKDGGPWFQGSEFDALRFWR